MILFWSSKKYQNTFSPKSLLSRFYFVRWQSINLENNSWCEIISMKKPDITNNAHVKMRCNFVRVVHFLHLPVHTECN